MSNRAVTESVQLAYIDDKLTMHDAFPHARGELNVLKVWKVAAAHGSTKKGTLESFPNWAGAALRLWPLCGLLILVRSPSKQCYRVFRCSVLRRFRTG